MWVSRKVFEELIHDRSQAQGIAHALEMQATHQQAAVEWLRVRLTQLEHERAQLLFRYMGVQITVPNIEPTPSPRHSGDLFNQLPSFEDVGDAEAARQGITWNNEGEVVYAKQ